MSSYSALEEGDVSTCASPEKQSEKQDVCAVPPTTGLLVSPAGSRGGSSSYSGSQPQRWRGGGDEASPRAMKFLDNEAVPWSTKQIGLALKSMEGWGWLLFSFWQLLVVNTLLVCTTMLVIKASGCELFFGETLGTWRIADLSPWPLQFANLLLVVSYSLSNYLYLRLCLSLACACFMLFALTGPVGTILDMLFFNFAMALLNLYHAFMHLYNQRYVPFPTEFEQVYCARFQDFMTRVEFEKLMSICLVRRAKADTWMKLSGDEVTSLCVVVSGRVGIYRGDGNKIDEHVQMDILEAPEWVRSGLNPEEERFNVSFKVESSEGLLFLKWPRESLVDLLQASPSLKTEMRAVLGIQTAVVWTRTTNYKQKLLEGADVNVPAC